MRYVKSKIEQDSQTLAYRVYVTESLRLRAEGKVLSVPYMDIIKKEEIDNRTGDEIAEDVIRRLGLKVGEE